MTCYKFECSHWWNFFLNPLQDFFSSLNAVISTNESTEFITGHVIYNPAHTYKFQLKTTIVRRPQNLKKSPTYSCFCSVASKQVEYFFKLCGLFRKAGL